MTRNLLVVDDQVANRKIITNLFKDEYTILEASNCLETLNVLRTTDISIVIIDTQNLVQDGYETIKEIRKEPVYCDLPIIALIDESIPRSKEKALESGANECVLKPLSSQIALLCLENIVHKLELARVQSTIQQFHEERIQEDRIKEMIGRMNCGVLLLNMHEGAEVPVAFFNSYIAELCGYTEEEFREYADNQFERIVYPFDRSSYNEIIIKVKNGDKEVQSKLRVLQKNGGIRWLKVVAKQVIDDAKLYVITLVDVTNEERGAGELRYRADYDSLTNIYKEEMFYRESDKMMVKYSRLQYCLVRINISEFRLINELYGRENGDGILVRIAMCLEENADKKTVYGRLGSDHFTIIFPYDQNRIESLYEKLYNSINRSMNDHKVLIDFGVYICEEEPLSSQQMCLRANLAVNTIKGKYLEHIAYYDESMRQDTMEKQSIRDDMEAALENEEFEVYFQPLMDAFTSSVCGAEALVRWNHPKRGVLMPGVFIPLFEENGFIAQLDLYMWKKVCAYQKSRNDRGLEPLGISVNASRVSLYNQNLARELSHIADEYGIDHSLLKIEVTESAYKDNPVQLIETVNVLREEGFPILMDDFGSGYSSLNTLKDMAVDILKIDLKFLEGFETNERSGTIVSSIVKMCGWLKIKTVAEGVETIEQVRFLRSIGCDMFQGYYYSKPITQANFEQFIQDHPVYLDKKEYTPLLLDSSKILSGDTLLTKLIDAMFGGAAFYEYTNGSLQILRVSANYYSVLGYEGKFDRSKDALDMVVEEDKEKTLDAFLLSKQTNAPQHVTVQREKNDGTIGTFFLVCRYIGDIQGNPCFFACLNDITETSALSEKVQANQTHNEILVRDSNLSVLEWEHGTGYFTMSESFKKYRLSKMDLTKGLPKENVYASYVYPQDEEKWMAFILNDDEESVNVRLCSDKEDTYRYTKVKRNSIVGKKNQTTFTLITFLDYDDVMRAYIHAEEAKGAADRIVTTLPIGITVLHYSASKEVLPLYYSDASLKMLGISRDTYREKVTAANTSSICLLTKNELDSMIKMEKDRYLNVVKYTTDKDEILRFRLESTVKKVNEGYYIYSVVYDITDSDINTSDDTQKMQMFDLLFEETELLLVKYRADRDQLLFSYRYSGQKRKALVYDHFLKTKEAIPSVEEKDIERLKNVLKYLIKSPSSLSDNFSFCFDQSNTYHGYHLSMKSPSCNEVIALGENVDTTSFTSANDLQLLLLQSLFAANINYEDNTIEMIMKDSENAKTYYPFPLYLKDNSKSELVHQEDREKICSIVNKHDAIHHLNKGENIVREEIRILNKSRKWVWIEIMVYLFYKSDKVKGIVYAQEIDQRKKEEEKLQFRAYFDGLTGLYNHTTFEEEVGKRLQLHTDRGQYLILMDMDDFKVVNDQYGHLKGDEVLRLFAAEMKKILVHGQIFGRFGGDEFLFYEEANDRTAIEKTVQRLSQSMIEIKEELNVDANLSLSIGIVKRVNNESYTKLFEKADKTMYSIKQKGKHGYTFFQE